MSTLVTSEENNFVVVVTNDDLGGQALMSMARSLASSRWESHKALAARIRDMFLAAEPGEAIDFVLTPSAAKRIEDDIHYRSVTQRVTRGAKAFQVQLAEWLGLDAERPVRCAAKVA